MQELNRADKINNEYSNAVYSVGYEQRFHKEPFFVLIFVMTENKALSIPNVARFGFFIGAYFVFWVFFLFPPYQAN